MRSVQLLIGTRNLKEFWQKLAQRFSNCIDICLYSCFPSCVHYKLVFIYIAQSHAPDYSIHRVYSVPYGISWTEIIWSSINLARVCEVNWHHFIATSCNIDMGHSFKLSGKSVEKRPFHLQTIVCFHCMIHRHSFCVMFQLYKMHTHIYIYIIRYISHLYTPLHLILIVLNERWYIMNQNTPTQVSTRMNHTRDVCTNVCIIIIVRW